MGQAALGVVESAVDDRGHVTGVERLEDDDPAPRQQGRVHLERRILGRGPDQTHGAILDCAQEGVLLGLVEAMDLVDEEDRACTASLALPGLVDGGTHLTDAGKHRRERDEFRSMLAGDQAREGRLAAARWPPEDQRRQLGARPGERQAQERLLADDIGLTDKLGEGTRPHALGQGASALAGSTSSAGSSNRLRVSCRAMD